MADLEHGKVTPMLQARKVGHRPRGSHEREVVRATAAAALDVMVVGGIKKKEAARLVARELAELGYRDPPGRRITAAKVEDWRERMMTDLPSENVAVGRFRRARQHFQEAPPSDPRAQAMAMLRNLASITPPARQETPPD
ncbi:MAG: hypothetical protein JOZ17_17390 [Acetobacteraceae bacterium]|nr:hypothetical protein [Acetobacteraceae bacterium]